MAYRIPTSLVMAITALTVTAAASAQPIMDGYLDSDYPSYSSLQGIETSFGDADYGQPGFCNGSELNAIHIDYRDGFVVIFLAGNLESNYNKLEVFVDARAGGQNQLRHDNSETDYEGLLRMGNSNENATDGLKFDNDFVPDIWVSFTCSDDGNGAFITHANYAPLLTDGGGFGFYLGSGSSGTEIINGENGIQIAIDNSNIGGVTGGTGSSCGVDVGTGIEIAIPNYVIDWDFEGLPFDDVKVCAFINNPSHDHLSNQVLAGMPPAASLGDPRGTDFSAIPGDQFARMGDVAKACPEYNYGACCLGEVCVLTSEENCTAGSGDFQGVDSECLEETCQPPDCPSDINDDGVTGVDDLLELLAHYGEYCI